MTLILAMLMIVAGAVDLDDQQGTAMMLDKIIAEEYVEDRNYARATVTFAMTKHHVLAGEEMLAVHWDKQSVYIVTRLEQN
eukprot:747062-Hanusia_phi.AAC.2